MLFKKPWVNLFSVEPENFVVGWIGADVSRLLSCGGGAAARKHGENVRGECRDLSSVETGGRTWLLGVSGAKVWWSTSSAASSEILPAG